MRSPQSSGSSCAIALLTRCTVIAPSLLVACSGAAGPSGSAPPDSPASEEARGSASLLAALRPLSTRPIPPRTPRDRCRGFASEPVQWPVHDQRHVFGTGMHNYIRRLGDQVSLIDVDGDRKLDLVFSDDARSWSVHHNTGAGFAAGTPWSVPLIDPAKPELTRRPFEPNEQFRVIDIDGDGRVDLVQARDPTSDPFQGSTFQGPRGAYWRVYRGTARGFTDDSTPWAVPSASFINLYRPTDSKKPIALVDMDADGLVDLVHTGQNQPHGYPAKPHWRVYLNLGDGTGFAAQPTAWVLPKQSLPQTFATLREHDGSGGWSLLDLDGDGRPDLVHTRDPEATQPTVFQQDQAPSWLVYRNRQREFVTPGVRWWLPSGYFTDTTLPTSQTSTTVITWDTIDMGGNGAPDLVLATDPASVDPPEGAPPSERPLPFDAGNVPQWVAFLNRGDAFSFTHEPWELPSDQYHRLWLYRPNGGGSWDAFDIDGDGCTDLVDTAQPSPPRPHGAAGSWHWLVYRGQ